MLSEFKGKLPKISQTAFIADSAELIGDVDIGEHSSVWFGAVIRGDRSRIKIGDRTNIQDNAVIHSDPGDIVEVGDNVTVGHAAVLHGCKIGNNVIVGMNATILDGADIGENSIVGAGALVSPGKKFPAKSIILGIPAAAKREAAGEDVQMIRESAQVYVRLTNEYKGKRKKTIREQQQVKRS